MIPAAGEGIHLEDSKASRILEVYRSVCNLDHACEPYGTDTQLISKI